MAQAAKQLKVRKDLAEAAAQELRDKEEEKLKKRNRSRDRRRKVNLPAGGEENRAARKRGETENEREGEGEVRRKKEGVADCCRALPLRSSPLSSLLLLLPLLFSCHYSGQVQYSMHAGTLRFAPSHAVLPVYGGCV